MQASSGEDKIDRSFHRQFLHFRWSRSEPWLPRTEDGAFGIGEFLFAPVVTAFVDEFLRGSEIGLRRLPRILHPSAGVAVPGTSGGRSRGEPFILHLSKEPGAA